MSQSLSRFFYRNTRWRCMKCAFCNNESENTEYLTAFIDTHNVLTNILICPSCRASVYFVRRNNFDQEIYGAVADDIVETFVISGKHMGTLVCNFTDPRNDLMQTPYDTRENRHTIGFIVRGDDRDGSALLQIIHGLPFILYRTRRMQYYRAMAFTA